MINKFFNRKKLISAFIIGGGVLIAVGILLFSGFSSAKIADQFSFTEKTGVGIFAPACSSSSPTSFCSGSQAKATVSWARVGPHSCEHVLVVLSDGQFADFQSCSGSYTFNVNNSQNYSYTVYFMDCFYTNDFGGCAGGYSPQDSTIGSFSSPNCNPAPTASISADSTSLYYNTGTTIRWSSTNATSCTVSPPGWTGTSGAQGTGNLTSSQTYTVNCSGPGGSASNSVNVNVGGPPTSSLSANPTTIAKGQSSTLSWSSTNATSCSIDQGIGGVPTSGSRAVAPSKTITYTITCSGPGASAQSSATITVLPPGNFQIIGSASACNVINLSWTASTGADGYRIYRGSPRVDITPYQPYTALNFTDTSVSQNATYKYQVDAYNDSGTKNSNVENVTTPFCPPTLSFSGSPTSIFQGQSSTLTWSSSFATSCAASGGWSGGKPVNGSEVVVPLPPPSVTYALTCSGPGGSVPGSVTINISSLALPEFKEIIPR